MTLFARDSAEDLFCRGFSQAAILEKTGRDIGYRGASLRSVIAGVNRIAYQVEFVVRNFDKAAFVDLLNQYGDKLISKPEVLVSVGLSDNARVGLKAISEAFGVLDAYVEAHRREQRNREDKRRATMIERFGAETIFKSDYFKDKSKATCLERYGVESSAAAKTVRDKMKATMVERYGVEHPMQSSELAGRMHATMRARYGVSSSLESADLRAKARETMTARYGAPTTLESEVLAGKVRSTLQSRYGVENSMRIPGVREKASDTILRRHGVQNPMQSAAIRAKSRATMLERYGHEYAGQVPEAMEKRAQTCIARYGTDSPIRLASVQAKRAATCRERYGVDVASQNPDVIAAMLDAKRAHGTFHTSEPEEWLYGRLVELFGEDDVIRQYSDDRYPFCCDFYVRSRDLLVELNGHWSHGMHWYGESVLDDMVVEAYSAREGAQYPAFVDVWTKRDVMKREAARKNNLNYVVLWGPKGEDIDLWFAMGCPDGRDWERTYSWLPERDLDYDGTWSEVLKPDGVSIQLAARMANWREFYKREIALWEQNYDNKWGTVQARLYANRLKYIGKKPDELTNREILRGLNISGMVHAYSIFDNSGMLAFLDRYGPVSIYDPCAGWGERLLTCAIKGIKYQGVDINPEIPEIHVALTERYEDQFKASASTSYGDASKTDMTGSDHDAVFTCPPYEAREIYTADGAENLSHDDFLAWWRDVVMNATGFNTKYFAYQIDQQHKADMNQVLLDLGWTLDAQIPVGKSRVSHMNRSQGKKTKSNFEEVQVFVR